MNTDLSGSDYQIAFDFLLKLPMQQHIRNHSVEYEYHGQPIAGIRYNNAQHCIASHLAHLLAQVRGTAHEPITGDEHPPQLNHTIDGLIPPPLDATPEEIVRITTKNESLIADSKDDDTSNMSAVEVLARNRGKSKGGE